MKAASARLLALVVFAASIVPFLPALSGEFLNWDDVAYIVDNPHWKGLSRDHLAWMFTTFEAGHYQPFSWLSLAVDHAAWGMDPWGYHLTSQILHAVNATLLYLVILRLLGSIGGWTPIAAAFGALFFAVHPLRTEVVAWITERRDVLSTTFLLGAFLAYLRAVRSPAESWRWHGAAIALLAASLLAKAWGMTFAIVLLVVDVCVLRRPWSRSVLFEKIPYLALGLTAAVVAMFAQRSVGATAALADHHWLERLLQGGYGACFYLARTVLPTALSPLYLLEEQRDLRDIPLYWFTFIGVALATLLVTLAARRAPWLFAAWACYLVIVSPVLGLLQSGAQLVADRYSYIACMPWAVLAAAGLDRILRSSSEDRAWTRFAATATAALVLVVLTTMSLRQSTHWRTTLRADS